MMCFLSRRKPIKLAVAIVLVMVVGTSAALVLAAMLTSYTQRVQPDCAWPGAINADTISTNNALNIRNPDTASAYWVMAFWVQDGLRIDLSGRYPASRYMSFAVYTSHGTPFTMNGVASTLTDYQIAPDLGSINPWQQPAPPGGRFSLTLRSDVAPGQVNTLPLAPTRTAAGTIGLIFLRVYVPAQGDSGQVPLPSVTFTLNGVSTQLAMCAPNSTLSSDISTQALRALGVPATIDQPTAPATVGPPATPGAQGKVVPFASYPPGAGGTVDTDTGYLSATVVPPQNGDVLVVHGKAPTTPSGSDPRPWPSSGEEMRYWSLCSDLLPSPTPVVINHLADGNIDDGCRYDSQVTLDQDGYYTFVVGTEAQRAAIENIHGDTFLPFSTADPTQTHKLNIRNMVANPAFVEAVQNVPANGRPESAAAVMGAYYPRAAFCALPTLATSGPEACFGSAS
jgi:hypothetical protein